VRLAGAIAGYLEPGVAEIRRLLSDRRRLVAGVLAAAVVGTPLLLLDASFAAPHHPTVLRRARAVLARRGYHAISLHCGGRRCRWTARHGRARCTGTLVVRPGAHGRVTVRLLRTRCSRPAARHEHGTTPPQRVSTAPPSENRSLLYGFNTYTTPQTVLEQRTVGVSTTRLFVNWPTVEPAPGQWDWQSSDDQYGQITAGGLRPLIVAFAAPCWARPSTDCSNPNATGPPDPTYDAAWSDYIRQLATRYPAAVGIEIWNEPNLDQFWLPRPDPVRFTQLLSEAYRAVKAVSPTMPVISGGLLLDPPLSGQPVESDTVFLSLMYAAGAKRWMDGLGVHVYPVDYDLLTPTQWDPQAMRDWLGRIEAVRTGAGASSEPLWITEMGVSTATQADWPPAATPEAQATDLIEMLHIAQDMPDVAAVVIQSLQDQDPGYADPNNAINTGWGVFSADWTPKPAACALSRAFGGSVAC
jgi:polysaccharide biosynthesis protein PslG